MEPFCSFGGTGRAGTRFSSVKLWLALEYVTSLEASTRPMRPEIRNSIEGGMVRDKISTKPVVMTISYVQADILMSK